jgi:hypothetical protein
VQVSDLELQARRARLTADCDQLQPGWCSWRYIVCVVSADRCIQQEGGGQTMGKFAVGVPLRKRGGRARVKGGTVRLQGLQHFCPSLHSQRRAQSLARTLSLPAGLSRPGWGVQSPLHDAPTAACGLTSGTRGESLLLETSGVDMAVLGKEC